VGIDASFCAIIDGANAAIVEAYRDSMRNDPRCFKIDGERPLTVLPDQGEDDCISIIAPGDTLPENSLAIVAEALAREPALVLVYGDEDAIAQDGTLHSPVFKPDWSPIFQRGASYLGRLTCVRRGNLIASGYENIRDLYQTKRGGSAELSTDLAGKMWVTYDAFSTVAGLDEEK
jgi:hypothetical protein